MDYNDFEDSYYAKVHDYSLDHLVTNGWIESNE